MPLLEVWFTAPKTNRFQVQKDSAKYELGQHRLYDWEYHLEYAWGEHDDRWEYVHPHIAVPHGHIAREYVYNHRNDHGYQWHGV